jgi:hypothetical protein
MNTAPELCEAVLNPRLEVLETNGEAVSVWSQLAVSICVSDIAKYLKPFLVHILKNLFIRSFKGTTEEAEIKFDNIHHLLISLSKAIPQAIFSLISILTEQSNFGMLRDLVDNKFYQTNLLKLSDNFPSIRRELLEIAYCDLLTAPEDHLDALMFIWLKWIDSCGDLDNFFKILCLLFVQHSLPKRLSNSPFILFYCCSKSAKYPLELLQILLEKMFSSSVSTELRKNACFVLTGFLARFLKPKEKVIIKTVGYILDGLIQHIQQTSLRDHVAVSDHMFFYQLTSCLCYTLCFKMTANFSNIKDSLDLVLSSKFAPLLVMDRELAKFFMDKYKVCFGTSTPKQNTTINIKMTPLEEYYPFNPCTFMNTGMYLEKIYHQWTPETDITPSSLGFSQGNSSFNASDSFYEPNEDDDDEEWVEEELDVIQEDDHLVDLY